MSFWCLQLVPKNEWKQGYLCRNSKVEFVCLFFGGNVGLKKSFWLFLTFSCKPSIDLLWGIFRLLASVGCLKRLYNFYCLILSNNLTVMNRKIFSENRKVALARDIWHLSAKYYQKKPNVFVIDSMKPKPLWSRIGITLFYNFCNPAISNLFFLKKFKGLIILGYNL